MLKTNWNLIIKNYITSGTSSTIDWDVKMVKDKNGDSLSGNGNDKFIVNVEDLDTKDEPILTDVKVHEIYKKCLFKNEEFINKALEERIANPENDEDFVVLKKEWPDFYNFTFGGKEWVSFVTLFVILCVTYAISAILVFSYKKLSNQNSRKRPSIKG